MSAAPERRCTGRALGVLVSAAVSIATLLLPARPSQATPRTSSESHGVFVTPAVARDAAARGALLLDVRSRLSYWLGHAPGAIRVAWDEFSDPGSRGRIRPDDAWLSERLSRLGVRTDREVYVIGDWDRGWGEEGRLFWMLEYLGHPHVHIVRGGMSAWRTERMPLHVGPSPSAGAGAFPVQRQPQRSATAEQIEEGDAVLLDTRTSLEFGGATPFGSERGGHIPGARHLYWRDLFDGRELLPESELRALLPPADEIVITYCTGGVRSAFVYAVLRDLGFERVRNYPGSWWEWSASNRDVE